MMSVITIVVGAGSIVKADDNSVKDAGLMGACMPGLPPPVSYFSRLRYIS